MKIFTGNRHKFIFIVYCFLFSSCLQAAHIHKESFAARRWRVHLYRMADASDAKAFYLAQATSDSIYASTALGSSRSTNQASDPSSRVGATTWLLPAPAFDGLWQSLVFDQQLDLKHQVCASILPLPISCSFIITVHNCSPLYSLIFAWLIAAHVYRDGARHRARRRRLQLLCPKPYPLPSRCINVYEISKLYPDPCNLCRLGFDLNFKNVYHELPIISIVLSYSNKNILPAYFSLKFHIS